MKFIKWCWLPAAMMLSCSAFAGAHFGAKSATHHHSRLRHHKVASYTGPVNINTADQHALMSVKGLGAKKVAAILAYRKQNGSFKSLSDLSKVKGISAKTVQRLEKKNPGRLKISETAN